MKKEMMPENIDKNEIIVYQPEGGEFHIEVRIENETVWLSQAQMAELFHATKQNISLHITKIFKEGELDPKVVVKEYLTTTLHGAISGKTQVHAVKYYNLDVIISVGYRINQRMFTKGIEPTNLLQAQQLQLEKQGSNIANIKHSVNSRLTAVEQRVDFFVNTVHNAQNQKINQLSNDVKKVMEHFIDPTTFKHFLILDGQKLEADIAYTKIYGMAKKNIIIIDNFSLRSIF
ncbi:hypothetical protein [Fibrobacter succinogenes]|uniref:hypothetical protein n=1 Tax=Fibrobacter succinogenes TaxID=833 RepID=UPI0026EEFB41|nr:hypothetical protein [Fibrobacter succinogenes]